MKPMFVNGMAALFFVNSQIADFYPKVNSVCSTFLRFASHRGRRCAAAMQTDWAPAPRQELAD